MRDRNNDLNSIGTGMDMFCMVHRERRLGFVGSGSSYEMRDVVSIWNLSSLMNVKTRGK